MYTKICTIQIFLSIIVTITFAFKYDEIFNMNDNKNTEVPYIFYTETLPKDLNFMPTIGNGHLGFTIFSHDVYLNGVYNGKHGLSHRARIPNYSNLILTSKTGERFRKSYSLNVQTGVFQIRKENDQMKVIQLIYAHRYYNRIIVNQIFVYRINGNNDELKIQVRQEPGPKSTDINFQPPENFTTRPSLAQSNNRNYYIIEDRKEILHQIQGLTNELEDEEYQKEGSHVCCLWNQVPEELTLATDQSFANFNYFMSVDQSCNVAQQEINDVLQRPVRSLLSAHHEQWKNFWDTISIMTPGNLELGKAISGSLFYLASSLPSFHSNQANSKYFGLSPTGLGRGGTNLDDYEGHNFWDTEIWMLPTVTQMDPRWTRQLLNYRLRMLDTAKDNAKKLGFKGAKFPWESAFTGTETTQPCCENVALLQHHITADISFALQHYFSVTYDSEWLHNEGCPLAENIAEFWSSRVQPSATMEHGNYWGSRQIQYDIKYVMGPDEDHPNVTNNVFTNVVASYALRFGELARSICSYHAPTKGQSKWIEIADNLKILYDSVKDYHPQYEGYKIGTIIKQADTILLGYPLLFPMNDSTRRNDLRIYESVTQKTGPAMTWSMHAINHLDVGEFNKANELFNRSFQSYVRPPFQVFSEVIEGKNGAVNFLTGAGGFLQAVINGYAGVRIFIDRMEVIRPNVTPNSSKLSVSGIKYLGSTFKITATAYNASYLHCTSIDSIHPLVLTDGEEQFDITKNFIYEIESSRVVIKSKRSSFMDWR